MLIKVKTNKIEKSGSGVKFAHLELTINKDKMFDLLCTEFSINVVGTINIKDLRFLIDRLGENALERRLCAFAKNVIKADDIINEEVTLELKTKAKKSPAKKITA